MEKNNCNSGHRYGLWQIENEKEVSRICLDCSYKQNYPMTSDSLKEIKKQQEATRLLTSFLNVSSYDNNLIGYINIILDDVLNYINLEKTSLLITKLNEFIEKSILNEENKTSLEKIIYHINGNNQEELSSAINYFKLYNNEVLNSPPIQERASLSK